MYSPVSCRMADKLEWLISLRREERDFMRLDLMRMMRLEGKGLDGTGLYVIGLD